MDSIDLSNAETVANFVLANLPRHKLFVLSTVDTEGYPWAVCLNVGFDNEMNIIWRSRKDTEHSKHLLQQPNVSVCIFSKDETLGDFGFYAKGLAEEIVNEAELEHLLALRFSKKGEAVPEAKDYLGDSSYRLYRAKLSEAWLNERSHSKTPIDLGLLRDRAKHFC